MGCVGSKKKGEKEMEEQGSNGLNNSILRDKRLDITDVKVTHKIASIVRSSNKDRETLMAYKGSK